MFGGNKLYFGRKAGMSNRPGGPTQAFFFYVY